MMIIVRDRSLYKTSWKIVTRAKRARIDDESTKTKRTLELVRGILAREGEEISLNL
jgi:hypothetical protein